MLKDHPDSPGVQDVGATLLALLCYGQDSTALTRQQSAVDDGVVLAVVTALMKHPNNVAVQESATRALESVCSYVQGVDANSADGEREASSPCSVLWRSSGSVAALKALSLKRMAVQQGAITAIVKTLLKHPSHSGVQDRAARALRNVCNDFGAHQQLAADAGAIPASVQSLKTHIAYPQVVEASAGLLAELCRGTDEAALYRRRVAADASAVSAAASAMVAHTGHAGVQKECASLLACLCSGDDPRAVNARKQAAEKGAIGAVVQALNCYSDNVALQVAGISALNGICSGSGPDAQERRKLAREAGAVDAVMAARTFHLRSGSVQKVGSAALRVLNLRAASGPIDPGA